MSMPTANGSTISVSDSVSTGRIHWYDSSSRNPPLQPCAAGCSGSTSGGAASWTSVSAPGLGPDIQPPVASARTARVGGRNAVISSRPQVAVEPRGVMTRWA